MIKTQASTYRGYWERAYEFSTYSGREVDGRASLWGASYRKAAPSEWAVERALELGVRGKLLELSEDWCGDAFTTVPVLVRFAEAVPGIELRVLKRDQRTGVAARC